MSCWNLAVFVENVFYGHLTNIRVKKLAERTTFEICVKVYDNIVIIKKFMTELTSVQ